jgi:hypothetical protein
MKKCPTCEKTFEDSMRFCQADGTPLVDDTPFDPYATIVGTAAPKAAAPTDPPAGGVSSVAIDVPDDVLEMPEKDPLKTMYASDAEMKEVLGTAGQSSEVPAEEIKADVLEIEPAAPPPPSFNVPDLPSPSFNDAPPPSPFAAPHHPDEAPVPAPAVFDEPLSEPNEMETLLSPAAASPLEAAAPPEWRPPPVPDANWQNQEMASNTPPGAAGQNKTLAIISLITGIASLFCCGWFIPGIAAIIMGFIAKGKASSDPANYGGAGLAIGGMITGAISLVLGVIVVVLYLLGFAANLLR